MADFQEKGWIHELAKAELYPDASKLIDSMSSQDPQLLIEESAVNFLTRMREVFQDYARAFNAFSEAGKRFSEVKIYSVAQTPADFMVFRNQIKLVFSCPSSGMIQMSFYRHRAGVYHADGSQNSGGEITPPQELIARVGPFRDVDWTFQGERVQPEQVAKFYFSEFVRVTRDVGASPSSRQFILEQIKTLLQEKGFEL